MRISSFTSLSDAELYFKLGNPDLSCDFQLVIDTKTGLFSEALPLVSFNMPQAGLSFSQEPSLFGHPVPSFNTNSITIQYIRLNDRRTPSIKALWGRQFSSDGVLQFIPHNQLPDITIRRTSSENEVLAKFTACKFTYPEPQINLSSLNAVVYSTTVTFENFELY